MDFVDKEADKMKSRVKEKGVLTPNQAAVYAKTYGEMRKTKEGSPKSLYGGKYSHEKALEAAKKVK